MTWAIKITLWRSHGPDHGETMSVRVELDGHHERALSWTQKWIDGRLNEPTPSTWRLQSISIEAI